MPSPQSPYKYPESTSATPGAAQEGTIKIVQMADDEKTLPDGSKVIYAESDTKIVLHQKKPMEDAIIYVFDRITGEIEINGKKGGNTDKRNMIELGKYLMSSCKETDLVTISVQKADRKS